jgi:phosphorylase kinase alpha/beta subunit
LVVPIWHESADGWFVPVTGSTREERLQRLADSTDPDEMIALILASIETSDFDAPVAGRGRVRDVAHGLYDAAGRRQAWQIVRRVAGLLDLVDERLTDMHKELVVRLRRIAIKAPGQADAFSESPEPGAALRKRLSSAACNDRLKTVLAEETLIHLGAEIKANPTTFSGCRTVRIWEWIALLEQEPAILARGQNLADCAPHFISQAVRDVLNGSVAVRTLLASGEAHHVANQGPTDWRLWRSRLGVLTRVGDDFFDRVWRLLGRCDGLVVGEAHAPGARIDSRIIRSDHTPHERGFALLLEDALSRIASGPYRTLTLEAINAAASACEIDAGFSTLGDLSLDAIIHDALRKADGEGEEALRSFVARSPWDVAARLGQSLRALYGA